MMALQKSARIALQCMDLTSLNTNDDRVTIDGLVAQTTTPFGSPAALCIYPEYLLYARQALQQAGLEQVRLATVTNFPDGSANLQRALAETQRAAAAGADEIDLVFPYRAFLAGQHDLAGEMIEQCKQSLNANVVLKVILETGQLEQPQQIMNAGNLAIAAGADFLKTSTGKVSVNATLSAAELLLSCIQKAPRPVGFKAAGGVRTVVDAAAYIELASNMMGADWVTPAHFRLGASGLLADILSTLGQPPAQTNGSSY